MGGNLRAATILGGVAATVGAAWIAGGGGWSGVLVLTLGFWTYLAPTVIAVLNRHRQLPALIALNLLGGWTVIGWLGAMVWALIRPRAISTAS